MHYLVTDGGSNVVAGGRPHALKNRVVCIYRTMPARNDPAPMADRLLVGKGCALPASSGRQVRQATPMPSYRVIDICRTHRDGQWCRVPRMCFSSASPLFERLRGAKSVLGGWPRAFQGDEKGCNKDQRHVALSAAFPLRDKRLMDPGTSPLKAHRLALTASAACAKGDAYKFPTCEVGSFGSVPTISS